MNKDKVEQKVKGRSLAFFGLLSSLLISGFLWYIYQFTIAKVIEDQSVILIYFWDALAVISCFASIIAYFQLKKRNSKTLIAVIGMVIGFISIVLCTMATIGILAVQAGVQEALS